MEIPIFNVDIENTQGVFGISFVESPAINKNFVYQSEAKAIQLFQTDIYKREVTGPLLVPNQLIIRIDDEGQPFYIRWSKDTIYKSLLKWCAEKYSRTTIEHSELSTNTLLDLYIKDDGELWCRYHIDDDNLWQKILEGSVKGFSVEAECHLKN